MIARVLATIRTLFARATDPKINREDADKKERADPERERFLRAVEKIATRENAFRPVADSLFRLFSTFKERGFSETQALSLTMLFFKNELN